MKIDKFFGEYRFLSNFWPCKVEYRGRIFPSTENAFHAAKAPVGSVFDETFLTCTPAESKKLGRQRPLRTDWEMVKISVMRNLLFKKFSPQNLDLMLKLDRTGDLVLEEGNDWGDKFWGICDGEGENWLGLLLEEVRHRNRLLLDQIIRDEFTRLNISAES